MIRTANELRVSNFLLWQISYSEFYVTETLWPDFTSKSWKGDTAYAHRDRRSAPSPRRKASIRWPTCQREPATRHDWA